MVQNQTTRISTEPKPVLLCFQPSLFEIPTASLLNVAIKVSKLLLKGKSVTTGFLGNCMSDEYGKTDAQGGWDWKTAYDSLEMALVLYVRKRFNELSTNPIKALQELENIQNLLPTHTKRSEDTDTYQMFSTPLPLAYLVGYAAQISVKDTVLEPSSGTGLLAVWAQTKLAKLVLNELNCQRHSHLKQIFPSTPLYQFDAEHINDLLPDTHQPSVILMNPPFSASPKVNKRYADATINHIKSALYRLRPGGRLVTITADWFSPNSNKWKDPISKLPGKVVFSAGIEGKAYYKHGTTMDTRLTVIDKVESVESQTVINELLSLTQLAKLIQELVPTRCELREVEKKKSPVVPFLSRKATTSKSYHKDAAISSSNFTKIVDVKTEIVDVKTEIVNVKTEIKVLM